MALLLWSGGCDSTLLLRDLLTARNNAGKGAYTSLATGEFVRSLAIGCGQCAGSVRMRETRQKLIPKMEKIAGSGWVHGETVITRDGLTIDAFGGLPQPVLWILNASLYLDQHENLYAGYIRGDDFWHYSGWVHHAFDSIQRLTNRTGKLLTPLEWFDKSDVLTVLPPGLLKLTRSCEGDSDRPCGKCKPCKTHATAIWQMKTGKPRSG